MLCCVLSRFSRVRFFAAPKTAARRAPLTMGFSRQEYWSCHVLFQGMDLPYPGIKLASPALQADSFTH